MATTLDSFAPAADPAGSGKDAWDARRVRRRLLSLANRRRIVDHVEDNPGIHLRQVARDLGLALGTTEHHLHLLLRHGVLERHAFHGQACYFVAGSAPDPARKLLLSMVRQEAPRRLLRALAADPDGDAASLAMRLGVTPSTVAHHLQGLVACGLVERLRLGRGRLLRIARPEELAQALQAFDRTRPAPAWPGTILDAGRTRPPSRRSSVREPTHVRPPVRDPSHECTPGIELATALLAEAVREPPTPRSSSP